MKHSLFLLAAEMSPRRHLRARGREGPGALPGDDLGWRRGRGWRRLELGFCLANLL